MKRWAVFVSGEGSNLQNFLDLEKTVLRNQCIAAVCADRECRGIERAKVSQKPTQVLSPKTPDYSGQVISFLKSHQVDAIFLMGFMRILKSDFLKAWGKPIVNLHPSILPAYPGMNAIQKAFDTGDSELGVTLHAVTEELDGGPILKQLKFKRDMSASLESVTQQVHRHEYQIVREYLMEIDQK